MDNLCDEAKTNTEKAKEYLKSLEELKKDYSKCEYNVTKTFLQNKINKIKSLFLETERIAENNIKLFEKYNEVLKDNAI